VIQSSLIIFLNGFLNCSYGEVGREISDYHLKAIDDLYNTQEASTNPDNKTDLPLSQSPREKQLSPGEDAEESIYLAVYLNSRLLTEVIEAKEKGGSVYFKLKEMAQLFESAPPEDANAIATVEALEEIYPAKFNYISRLQALIIDGEGKLPIEKKWARDYNQKMLSSNSLMEDTPIVDFEYGLVGPPSVDVSANYQKNGHARLVSNTK
jgi:hypothetical protein